MNNLHTGFRVFRGKHPDSSSEPIYTLGLRGNARERCVMTHGNNIFLKIT